MAYSRSSTPQSFARLFILAPELLPGSDYLFNPSLTRSIHVDMQYVLWVMDAVDGAHGLMQEMGLTPKFMVHG